MKPQKSATKKPLSRAIDLKMTPFIALKKEDTPPELRSTAAEAETVAEATSAPSAGTATVQPDRIDARFRASEKMQCSKPSLSVDLRDPLGNLRRAIGLFGWRPGRFPRPSWQTNAFAQSETLGGTRSAM
jgi:hypothetical protein